MIFKHLPSEYIKNNFTSYGLLLFFIPVYIDVDVDKNDDLIILVDDHGFPVMHEANWVPKAVFFAASAILGAWMFAGMSVKTYSRVPILILGET